MTITANITERGGSFNGSQEVSYLEFKVTTDNETIDNELKALSAVFNDHKVAVGMPHPSRPGQRAVRYDASNLSNHKWWRVRYDFENAQADPGGEDVPDTEEIGFVDWNCSTSGKFVRIWRSLDDVTVPTGQGTTAPGAVSRTDIGGTKVDAAGEPQEDSIVTTVLTVEQVIGTLPNLDLYRELTNKRNSDASLFGDNVAGRWLYKGAQSARLDHMKYRITHQFAWDEWFHLRQQPLVEPDGRAKTDDAGDHSGTERHSADVVYWIQPFPDMGQMSQLGFEDPF